MNFEKYIIKFKDKYEYLSAIIISIAIIMWFRGVIGILDLIFRKKTIFNFIILILLAITVLFIMSGGIDPIFDIEQRMVIDKIKERHRIKNYNDNDNYNDNNNLALLATTSHRDVFF